MPLIYLVCQITYFPRFDHNENGFDVHNEVTLNKTTEEQDKGSNPLVVQLSAQRYTFFHIFS